MYRIRVSARHRPFGTYQATVTVPYAVSRQAAIAKARRIAAYECNMPEHRIKIEEVVRT